ncbi:MAG: hypothetical protein ABEL76_00720, partial [Bradymonadaceae bacterium]
GERGGGKDGSGGGDLQWAYRFAFSEALLPKVNVVSVVVSWTGVDTGNPVAVERATVERTRQNLRATPPG